MPCVVDPSPDEIRQSMESSRKKEKEVRNTINNLANMLCTLCADYEREGLLLPQNIHDWWIHHQEEDTKRLAAAKKRGLAKLDDEERIALGL